MEEISFLYGFLVGQVVLLLTGLFFLKQLFFSPTKSNKYTKIIIASNNHNKGEAIKKDTPNLVALINDLVRNFYSTLLFNSQLKEFLQKINILINERIKESSLQGSVTLSQLLLEKSPKIKSLNCLKNIRGHEYYAIELEWNNAGQFTAEGEIGTFGINLPFLSTVQIQHIALGFELEIGHLLFTVTVRSVEIDFEMENTLGHPLQLKDSHKKIETLLKSYIYAVLQSDIVNRSFMFPIK